MMLKKSLPKVTEKYLLIFVFILPFLKSTETEEELSDYQKTMSEWSGMCNDNYNQSPINIIDCEALLYNKFDPIVINDLDQNHEEVTITNTNEGVSILNFYNKSIVYGGPLHGIFNIDHIDFHSKSEHTFDGQRFELECEIVCHNKEYPGYFASIGQKDGIAVISVLYQLSKEDNKNIVDIIAAVREIQPMHYSLVLNKFSLRELLPHIGPYYTYTGSLTKPGCNGSVTWIIFRDRYPISLSQVGEIRGVLSDLTSAEIGNNFRLIKPTFRYVVLSEKNFVKGENRAARCRVTGLICFINFCSIKVINIYTSI